MNNTLGLLLVSSMVSCAQNNNDQTIENKQDFEIVKSENEWKKQLSADQYYVLREKGTEKPFTGELLLNKEKGIYKCAACGNELFNDSMKFDSECGWPSFDREIAGRKIIKKVDYSYGMKRTEIQCAKCGGHLGHLFNDGPTVTGQRYCVNSLSLEFAPTDQIKGDIKKESSLNSLDTIVLGGGCFWCTEAIYEKLKGVVSVVSGYSGGTIPNPTYSQVSTGKTGYAEVIRIIYDETITSLDQILEVYFSSIDPTTLNSQGADYGTQYRSVIFYSNEKQMRIAKSLITELNKEVYDGRIVTQVVPFKVFYKAEDYHQDYYSINKNLPYCKMVIQPKIEKFEKVFKDRMNK